ncbi:hypothetical protein [Cryobacterium sp. BB736]|uniref:hypothetical protein n=1 Tax=Cryobacterium sp. BB736 TaxID=2746963 RepID=UPI001873BAB8|nr:hypothetical protein [Cryobacterium sp. BB736]
MKRKLIGLAAIGSLVAGSFGIASAAQAATPEEVSSWIAEAALENLGLTIEDPSFAAAIAAAVQQALDAGLISVAVEDIAEGEVDEPGTLPEDEVDGVLDEELEEQKNVWDEIKEAWRTGHEEAHAAFTECRDAAEGGANLCAHEFRYAMQVNNIAAFQARHEARLLADAENMTEEELAKAEAKLAHHESIAKARLDRAAAHLEKKTGIVIQDDAVEGDVEEATEEALVTIQETSSVEPRGNNGKGNDKSDKPGKPAKSDKPAKGNNGNNGKGNNGNKGNNGKGGPNK